MKIEITHRVLTCIQTAAEFNTLLFFTPTAMDKNFEIRESW